MKDNVVLCIIFNHRYDQNIAKLDKIYNLRFSKIYYLVPFYNGEKNDKIIPIWESSYQFQGYIAQALSKIYSPDVEQYVFCADDIIINPNVNETNIQTILKTDINTSFIPKLFPIRETYTWIYTKTLLDCENAFLRGGASFEKELPLACDTKERFANYRCDVRKFIKIKDILSGLYATRYKGRFDLFKFIKYLFLNRGKHFYPLAYGDSDFFTISQKDITEFARICGIFAAMNLFVESAIPTAMILSCDKITFQTNSEINKHMNGNINGKDYNYRLKNLYCNWPENVFRIHPIKLSQWTIEDI